MALRDPSDPSQTEVHAVKRGLFSASIWSIAANLGTQTATFIIFLILARLLTPSDFGMVAIAMAFIDISRGVMLGGIPEALIQRKEWDEEEASAAFWINMAASLLFLLVILAGALVAATIFHSRSLGWMVLAALSFTLIIDSLRAVHEAHLRRTFSYKLLAKRSVAASILAGIAGIVAAFLGAGVWALVVQRMATSAIQTVVLWSSDVFRPRRVSLRTQSVKDLTRFGTSVLGARLLGQINRRLADFILGNFGGTHLLGLYRVGTRSLDYILSATVSPIQNATLSAFSRLQSSESRARAYVRSTQFTALTTIPAFLGAGAISQDFIIFAFGHKWDASAWPMMMLAFGVIPMTYAHYFQTAMQAAGRPAAASGPELLRLTVGAIILAAAAPFGLIWASSAEALRRYIVAPHIIQVLKRELGLSWRDAFHMVSIPAFWSILMFAVVVLARNTVLISLPIAPRLVICVLMGGAIYAFGMLVVSRGYTRDVWKSIEPAMPKKIAKYVGLIIR